MAYGYEGELVRLVPIDLEKHLANAQQWVNNPTVTEFLLIGHWPMTMLAEKDFFEAKSRSTDDLLFAIETLHDERHIGFSGVHQIDFRNGTATTGTLIGVTDEWGKGYGTDALRVRSEYAFKTLGLRMLLSAVIEGNERSLRMQQRGGYEVCGRIPRRWWKNGAYRDEILTCLERA